MKKNIGIFAVAFLTIGVLVGFLLTKPDDTPATADVPNPVAGHISRASAESITLKMDDGQEVTFKNSQNVPLDHLIEHQEDNWAVSIIWQYDGDEKVATRVDDAE